MNSSFTDINQLQRNVAINRDMHAYRQLFHYFSKPLIRFSISIVKSKEGAEEVYSDVMLKIWNIGSALNNIANLKAYLFESVKNASLAYIAKYNKARIVDIDSVNIDLYLAHSVMDNILMAEFHRQVYSYIKSLPPKCQMVYKLIKEDGFNYREVAQIMDISIKTVEGHMTRALSNIHASLRHYLHTDQN